MDSEDRSLPMPTKEDARRNRQRRMERAHRLVQMNIKATPEVRARLDAAWAISCV
jgi:hypothetical protein